MKNKSTQLTNDTEKDDALCVIPIWQGFRTRQQYAINPLPMTELFNYRAFMVGNMPKVDLSAHAIKDKKIALVGNSMLRSLQLILSLSEGGPVPKLIIVENSYQVITLWRKIRTMTENLDKKPTEEQAISAFCQLLQPNQTLYRQIAPFRYQRNEKSGRQYYPQLPGGLFRGLIQRYGLMRVIHTIRHATIIQQSWADKQLFPKLRNILKHNGIEHVVGFPSNIASIIVRQHNGPCDAADQVFKNLESLNPTLSIIANFNPKARIPTKVVVSTSKTASGIKQDFGWEQECEDVPKKSFCAIM